MTMITKETLAAATIAIWGSKAREIDELAPLLELKPGATIGEIGAGNGAAAVAAAQRIGPSGRLYATEIAPKLCDKIKRRVAKAGLHNVTIVEASANDTGLPAGACDAIFMIGVYHHFTDPVSLDAAIYRALKPGGRLVIVDFRPTRWLWLWKPKGVPANRGGHGVPLHILEDEVVGAGFELDRTFEHWGNSWFQDSFCLVFRRPAEARAA